jgi:hypothetical protein
VFRRSIALSLFALLAVVAVVLGACSNAPAAPALTDPKEILAKTAESLTGVKTVEFTGAFTGSVSAQGLGNFDLSTVKISGQADISNKKAKVAIDAPSLFGTKIDAILVDMTAYLKIAGPLAIPLHATADTWMKFDIPASSGNPVDAATDPSQAAQQAQDALNKLPTPPVKQADEKCGDQDCYHVTIHVSAADMKAMDPTSSVNGDVTVDVWTRKNDYRPAKIGVNVATVDMGTFGATFEFTYDGSVSIEAPPADQVVTPSFSLPNFALPSLPATQ